MSTRFDDKIATLREHLQKAVELELSTLPPYITAYASIKAHTNHEAASIIHSVFMEEMLHLLLAGNVLSAVGGTVRLGERNIPSYPLEVNFEGKRFRNREFEVDLARFSPAVIDTFMKIEQPDGWGQAANVLAAVPELDIEGLSIGEFYAGIQHQLLTLCDDFGEDAVFSGPPGRQITEQYYWYGGGKPVAVDGLMNANRAIQVIIDQGEGASERIADGDQQNFGQRAEVAHFYRFMEIAEERAYRPGDDPTRPTGAAIAVDYQSVWSIKANSTQSDYAEGTELFHLNEAFNRDYSLMLLQIEQAMGGTPKVLYTAIKNGMHRLARVSVDMMSRPIPGDPEGLHGAPSFQWIQPPL